MRANGVISCRTCRRRRPTVGLSQVGVTGVDKLVKIAREGKRPIVLTAELKSSSTSPAGEGGGRARNMEVIDEILEDATREAYGVEEVCGEAAERLLERRLHLENAGIDGSRVHAPQADAGQRPRRPSTVDIVASATATEDGTREEIGANVTGMTVCPCSQGMSTTRAKQTLGDLGVRQETITRSSSTRSPAGTLTAGPPRC